MYRELDVFGIFLFSGKVVTGKLNMQYYGVDLTFYGSSSSYGSSWFILGLSVAVLSSLDARACIFVYGSYHVVVNATYSTNFGSYSRRFYLDASSAMVSRFGFSHIQAMA